MILGVLVVVLGFFRRKGPKRIRGGSAFLFSGLLTIFMGFMMPVSGRYQAYAEM